MRFMEIVFYVVEVGATGVVATPRGDAIVVSGRGFGKIASPEAAIME